MNRGRNWLKSMAVFTAVAVSASLVACSNASFTTNKQGNRGADGTGATPTGVPFTSPTDPGAVTCHVEISKLSDCFSPLGVQGVNVWIVVDTSSSFTLREQVGRQLAKNFENGLRNNLPLTISVIAANSRESDFSSFGPNVFYRHATEPLVIHVDQASDFYQASIDLETKFSYDMKADYPRSANYNGGPDNNKHTGANELGLLNILNTMSRVSPGSSVSKSNYGMLVVFASDENDPCWPTANGQLTGNEPSGEEEMYYSNQCRWNNQQITPSLVYNSMKSYAGSRPLMVSGVLNQNGRVVLGDPGNSGVGHGYLQVVEQAKGAISPLGF